VPTRSWDTVSGDSASYPKLDRDSRLPIGLANVDRIVDESDELANGDGRQAARDQRVGALLELPTTRLS